MWKLHVSYMGLCYIISKKTISKKLIDVSFVFLYFLQVTGKPISSNSAIKCISKMSRNIIS